MPRTKAPEQFFNRSKVMGSKVVSRPVELRLPEAHPRQYELINALKADFRRRFIVGACGSKFGKTYGSTIALVDNSWTHPNSLNWWVAPTFAQSKMAYTLVKRLMPQDTFREYKADVKLVLLRPDGKEHSVIEFKSGDNPDSLRGFGVNFFIVDEAARVPYDSYVSVMTTVTQTRGKGFFISTPHGRGWFYELYQRGEKYTEDGVPLYDDKNPDPNPEWYSIRMPTWTNPTVSMEAIEDFRRTLPEDVFRQEIGAQFLLDSAGVFRGIKACIRGSFEAYVPGQRYIMGVDLARKKDYSVLTVMNANTRHVVAWERFNQISWEAQYARITNLARLYRAQVFMDSTGVGDPVVEAVQNSGVRVEPYQISGTKAKQQLIDKLRLNVENARISFPYIPILKKELEAYEYEISENGVVRFSAPSGQHDDTVISLALANWGADQAPFTYKAYNRRGI
jgi:hypothetical protein